MDTSAFLVLRPVPGLPPLPVVAHIPHASMTIPVEDRAGILLDDSALDHELLRMTDLHTDRLFDWVVQRGGSALVNGRSRLVMDPERFDDPALEPMEALGQGVVYTRTSDLAPLRIPDDATRERVMSTLYRPYHAALSALVAELLDAAGRCLVLDCHSFATHPLPSEADQSPDRPDICVGTDAWHTPPALVAALETAAQDEGLRVARDRPFDGALVPADRYRRDRRVAAVMLEIRRGLYCDESTGSPTGAFDGVRRALERICDRAGILA